MDLLLKLGIIIFMGMLGGKLAERFKLPNVSGYIVGGLIIGPSLLNIVKTGEADSFKILNDFALAAIAFSIGSEFLWEHIKKIGKNIMIITFAQVVGTMALVFFTLFLVFNQDFGFSLVASSIAAATAPAGIVLVIRELKAKGPLVDTILPVIAIDDALGLMAFGISLSVVKLLSFDDSISNYAKNMFIRISEKYNITLKEWNNDLDHIHIMFKAEPNSEISKFINAYKSASSRLIKKDFPEVKQKLWKQQFWSRSFCLITSGGASVDAIKEYIENQGKR